MEQAIAFRNSHHITVGSLIGGKYAHGILVVQPGRYGDFEVRDNFSRDYVYQELLFNGNVVNDNNPAGLGAHMRFIMEAKGRVLVNGVGLGGFLYRLIRKPNVSHITVVESDEGLTEMLESAFAVYLDKLSFVQGSPEGIKRVLEFDCEYLI